MRIFRAIIVGYKYRHFLRVELKGFILKKVLSALVLILLIAIFAFNQTQPADAAKTAKKKGLNPEVIAEYTESINTLTKKIYSRELYTPEDAEQLINLKLKLDEQMDILSEASFAPLYFKLGNIFRMRGNEKDAIICYQTVLENFSDTAYGPKSKDILTEMGVEIKTPTDSEEESKEEDTK